MYHKFNNIKVYSQSK